MKYILKINFTNCSSFFKCGCYIVLIAHVICLPALWVVVGRPMLCSSNRQNPPPGRTLCSPSSCVCAVPSVLRAIRVHPLTDNGVNTVVCQNLPLSVNSNSHNSWFVSWLAGKERSCCWVWHHSPVKHNLYPVPVWVEPSTESWCTGGHASHICASGDSFLWSKDDGCDSGKEEEYQGVAGTTASGPWLSVHLPTPHPMFWASLCLLISLRSLLLFSAAQTDCHAARLGTTPPAASSKHSQRGSFLHSAIASHSGGNKVQISGRDRHESCSISAFLLICLLFSEPGFHRTQLYN